MKIDPSDLPNYLIMALLFAAILLPLAVLISKAVKSSPRAKATNTGELYCSFCGKNQHEVQKLIAGPNVFICNECIRLCSQILDESLSSPEPAPQMDNAGPHNAMAKVVKKIISKAKERGYITYDELNKMLPVSEFTSEQIDETMALLSDIGINLVEDETEAGDES